jgi:small subunit ribosomal protein S3
MIERKFVSQNVKEFQVKTHLFKELTRAGLSDVKLQRTPLGDKVLVTASRPGLVVGRGGSNITKLTEDLKANFDLENPQVEIEEVDPRGNAAITAEMIANSLERFGSARFKGVGHKALASVMDSGALGVEILITGKIPSSRAKRWRFYQGYLKKCGDLSISGVEKAMQVARLKTGVVGIQVSIMPGNIKLPDKIEILKEPETVVEQKDIENEKEEETLQKDTKPKKESKKKKQPKKSETKSKKDSAKTENNQEKQKDTKTETKTKK